MERIRQSEKNKIFNEISILQKKIQRAHESNQNLLNGLIKDINFIKKTRETNDKVIDEANEKIKVFEEKIQEIDCGNMDSSLKNEINKNTKIAKEKDISTQKRKDLKKQENIPLQPSYYKTQTQNKNNNNNNINFVKLDRSEIEQKQYEKFLSIQVPDYIQKNLNSMPNNKGYIWKGVWFFGMKPAESLYPLIMYEKKYGSNDKIVHEIYSDFHYVYCDNGKNKVLIETVERKKL